MVHPFCSLLKSIQTKSKGFPPTLFETAWRNIANSIVRTSGPQNKTHNGTKTYLRTGVLLSIILVYFKPCNCGRRSYFWFSLRSVVCQNNFKCKETLASFHTVTFSFFVICSQFLLFITLPGGSWQENGRVSRMSDWTNKQKCEGCT